MNNHDSSGTPYHGRHSSSGQNSSQHPTRGSWQGSRGGRGRHQFGGCNLLKLFSQICGKSGHSVVKCYNRFDLSFHNASLSHTTTGSFSQFPQAQIATTSSINDPAWYLDSGATHHTTSNDASLTSKTEYYGPGVLTVGNGSTLPISHTGNSTLALSKPLYSRNIFLVPSIKKNLIRIAKFSMDNNVFIEFDASQCVVKDKFTKEIFV